MSMVNRVNPLFLAALLAPTLCAIAPQFVGSGVRNVRAAETKSTPQPTVVVPFELASSDHESVANMLIDSPFYFEQFKSPAEPIARPDVPARPQPTGPATLPEVHVTSVLPNPKNPLAIIDGKPHRVGDTLESGWTVMSINSDSTVTLKHTTGATIRVGLKNRP